MRLWVLVRIFDNKRFKKCAVFSGFVSFLLVTYMAYSYHSDIAFDGSYTDAERIQIDTNQRRVIRDRVWESNQLRFVRQQPAEDILYREFPFNTESDDVLVFLHIQKTGGSTFGRHLVTHLKVEPPCQCQIGKKRCNCVNSKGHAWLVSRYSTGWLCGLHADWTELHECVTEALNRRELPRERT